jgi:DNA-binding NtrC family response regulator
MQARLIVEKGAATPQVWELQSPGVVTIGRKRTNTIVLKDQHVSRDHAVIFHDDGRWFLRDCKATNGTKVDGQRIGGPTALENGQEIAIGDTRLRFTLDGGGDLPKAEVVLANEPPATTSSLDLSQTTLHADELTTLLEFMNASLAETSPRDLVKLALETVRKQTLADVCGFLSLDGEDPFFKIILPAEAEVDVALSRQLTEKVLDEDCAVWLGSLRCGNLESESLMAFRDALCVPLRACHAPAGEPPLGALHVYKTNRTFHDREVRFCEVLAGYLANILHVLRSRRALEADISRLRDHAPGDGQTLIGESTAIQQVRQQIAKIAPCPCTVLIVGESGVGKELVALGLHQLSTRSAGPLVPVNCAALPATMIEAELFGHEEGAFTGASRPRPGLFLKADEGTLFLDEIGELSLDAQAKLLRALETRKVCPIGGDAEIQVDVRIIAATNRDLEREVREGRFRKDLFFRLGTQITIPPLREHREDIPALAEFFLRKLMLEYRCRVVLSEAALQRLQNYSWPGNVRQLRSVLETAIPMAEGGIIRLQDLRLVEETGVVSDRPTSLNLEEIEAWAIRQALEQTGNNKVKAARLLGIHRDTLINKIKAYRIERPGEEGKG